MGDDAITVLWLEVVRSTNYTRELIHFMAKVIQDYSSAFRSRPADKQAQASCRRVSKASRRSSHIKLNGSPNKSELLFSVRLRHGATTTSEIRTQIGRAEIIINLPLKFGNILQRIGSGFFLFYGRALEFGPMEMHRRDRKWRFRTEKQKEKQTNSTVIKLMRQTSN